MRVSYVLGGLTLLASAACLCGQNTANAGAARVVAEVEGQQITLDQVEQGMPASLFQARQQYYRAQRAALEQWIDDKLLADEARRQQITVSQLLDRNINQQVKDPTDDQMEVFYEGVKTDQPFPAMRDKILQHIRELRTAKVRAAYMKGLRERAHVLITFAPPVADLASADVPMVGSADAAIRLVEFGDYQCPYCQQAYPVVKRLLENYGNKISFSFRDYPLPMHAQATKAAEAVHCAGVQGKLWEFHGVLFSNKKLAVADLKKEAASLSLDAASFDKCLDAGEQAAAVAENVSEAQRLQLTGTPTFFINGHLFDGSLTYEALRNAIDNELGARPKEVATAPAASQGER